VVIEEERAEPTGSFVQVVELTEKESVTLELLPMSHSPISYSDKFSLSQVGAGVYVVTNYPPISFPDFEVSRISRRTQVPGNES